MRVIPGTPDLVRFLADRFSPDQRAVLERSGGDLMLQGLEDAARAAARLWCGVDSGGPVMLIGATAMLGGLGAGLWYLTGTAVEQHARDCIRLWRRAAMETLAEFGAIRAEMPPYAATVRRMQRYGFTVFQPAPDSAGNIVCRCEVVSQAPQMLDPYSNAMSGAC